MKKDSLFELAEREKLPLFQFIDAKTVRWIKINEPKFGNVRSLKLPKMEILKHYIPNNIWFLESKEINSIHGLRHILRVAINAYLIAIKLRHGGKISNLIIASVLHDIRRRNDKGDSEHGLRSMPGLKRTSD